MARSVFYYHRKRLMDSDKYAKEKEEIKSIFNEHKGRYGYRRVTTEMKHRGYTINRKTVLRLMKEMGLKAVACKAAYRSYKGDVGRIAPNLLERDFQAQAPNQKWTTDVTQIKIGDTRIYFSPILDMYNGEVIAHNISLVPNLAQVYDMLEQGLSKFDDLEGLIFHSDQGWQYQHAGYRQKLKERGIVQSMSRKGNCLDNAMMESFFGTMKSELLYPNKFETPQEFIQALEEYIDYYNNRRIKSRLNGMSPVQFRLQAQRP